MSYKYKVCAYAICKNEERFVDRWMDHASEADIVVVVDTGSTDRTIEKLKARGAKVYSYEINPFRFDYSRNECLKYIPEDIDICVSSDLDDVVEAGWREKLDRVWTEHTKRGFYLYNWSFREDGSPGVQYTHQRIHARHDYHWIYPTHEVLEYTGTEPEQGVFIEGMVYNHYPDGGKDRSFNLPLLELAVQENPEDLRNMHYLGREYMFSQKWEKCIEMLQKYLQKGTWDEERSASMRFIARAYDGLQNTYEQKRWLYKAVAETPFLREPYMELARVAYREQDWVSLYYYCHESLKITHKTLRYVNEDFAWNFLPYDFAAIACYNLKLPERAIKYSIEAMKLDPTNERLRLNHYFYEEALKN